MTHKEITGTFVDVGLFNDWLGNVPKQKRKGIKREDAPKLRRWCRDCDRKFVPEGKGFEKYCPRCLHKRKPFAKKEFDDYSKTVHKKNKK